MQPFSSKSLISPVSASTPELPGFFDKLVGQRGSRFRRQVEEARDRSWAAVASWEDEYRLLNRRLAHQDGSARVASAWKRLRARELYLSGQKSPSRTTIEELSAAVPMAYDAFNSLTWKALHPQTDLEGCADICLAIERDLQLDGALAQLASSDPSSIAPHLANGRVIALLVATIRRREGDVALCSDLAIALLRAVLALALAPGMRAMAEHIWELVAAVVADLKRDGGVLRAKSEHLARFMLAIDDRVEAVRRATGRLGASHHMHPFPFDVKLSLFWPFALTFTSAEAEATELLEDLLSQYEARSSTAIWLSGNPIFVQLAHRN